MSTGQYVHVTRAAGTIVTAPLYNTAHQNHLTNDIPTSTGAHSDDVAMMQATLDPAPANVPAPVLDLGSEIEQLRFVIADVKTKLNAGVPPTQWYTPVTADATLLKAHGARVYRSTTQSIPSGVFTAVSFDTERYDTGVLGPGTDPFWTVVAPTKFVAHVAGIYAIVAFGRWNSGAASGVEFFGIRLNGSRILSSYETGIESSSFARAMETSTQYHLAANDYVELATFQTAGSPYTLDHAEFAIFLLKPDEVIPSSVTWTLTIDPEGTGVGTVTSVPGVIDAPSVPSDTFADGTVVVLTAHGDSFFSWSGDVPVGHESDNPLTVTMNMDRNITTNFAAQGVFAASGSSSAFSGTTYFSLTPVLIESATELDVSIPIPSFLTHLRSLTMRVVGLTAGQQLVCKFMVNGVADSIITVTMNGSGSPPAFQVGSATGDITINQSDLISVQAVLTGGGTAQVNCLTASYHVETN